jgi:hypothetical protein
MIREKRPPRRLAEKLAQIAGRALPTGCSQPLLLDVHLLSRNRNNQEDIGMAKCETCGNDYDKAFELTIAGRTHVFDSFECAIQAVAPTCNHCGCRILGHGVEKGNSIYCCAHCAGRAGASGLADRA